MCTGLLVYWSYRRSQVPLDTCGPALDSPTLARYMGVSLSLSLSLSGPLYFTTRHGKKRQVRDEMAHQMPAAVRRQAPMYMHAPSRCVLVCWLPLICLDQSLLARVADAREDAGAAGQISSWKSSLRSAEQGAWGARRLLSPVLLSCCRWPRERVCRRRRQPPCVSVKGGGP